MGFYVKKNTRWRFVKFTYNLYANLSKYTQSIQ